jgi:hypothetical protein
MKKISKSYFQIFSIVLISVVLASSHLITLKLNFSPKGDSNQENMVTDISTSSSASDYEYKWNRTWGGIYNDFTETDNVMAIDSSNNIYIVGRIDTTGSNNYDIVLIKCDSQGVEQWVRIWDGGASDEGNSILIDNLNEIYVVGMTASYADPDGDMVIIKYNSDGIQQWNFTWGGTELDKAQAIVKDSSNNYYIAGETRSFGEVDGDAILVKFDSNWVEKWNVTWGGGDRDYARAMEIDLSGNICIVGGSYSSDPSSGEADVMILKYDTSGSLIWDRDWGSSYTQRGPGIAIDSSNNIYFVGHTFGNPASSMKGHLVKYDTNGNYQWERIWGVSGVYGNSWGGITIDSSDEIFITGVTTTHGPYTGGEDVILLNYDTSGNQNWYKTWGMPGNERAYCSIMDSQHNLYLAGWIDSLGAGGYDILLMKYLNTLGPEISIITPISNSLYGTITPDFNINIDDPDYDFTWYSLDGGSTNIYSNETIGTIDQSEWDKQSNGTVSITFYANNSLGNVRQAEVTVRKDILAPLITINSPSENQVCGVDAPTFDLTILEHEVNATWYTLDYGSVNVSFIGSSGTIDQTEWAKKGGGSIPIRFYANDSFGNTDFSEVIIVKDLISPIISINSPSNNELFGSTPPNFDITVTESNPDSMWYTLDSGTTNVTFGSLTGAIDQTEWNEQGNGTVTIVFYAKDEGGNEGYAEVIVRKEISDPIIVINDPLADEVFGFTAPFFDVTVIEPDFDSMWYSLDDGINNVTAAGFTGDISQTEWNKKSSGMVIIKFYANDTLSNKGYAEVTVEKDVTDPIMTYLDIVLLAMMLQLLILI